MRQEHPPSVRLVLRVGVTGHRLDRLKELEYVPDQLEEVVSNILLHIRETVKFIHLKKKDLYTGHPGLRIVSPLAEGADRIVAQIATAIGYELQSPLPFHLDDYEKSFDYPDLSGQFRNLLSTASAVLELPGSLDKKSDAYLAVGLTVLQQSDVLLAIWDGQPAQKIGGTPQVIDEALRTRVPTIWIDARPPHRLLKVGTESSTPQELSLVEISRMVESILSLPNRDEVEKYQNFLAESQPSWKLALIFRFFCKLFVWKWPLPKSLRVISFQIRSCGKWIKNWGTLTGTNDGVGGQVEASFRVHYDWATGLAEILADRYRSAFVANYFMGVLAVVFAFWGFHANHDLYLAELALILGILAVVVLGHLQRWRGRWIDYRILAEGFRQMQFLFAFGRVTPTFEPPPFLEYERTGVNWFEWYFRAVVRQADLLRARIDDQYLRSCWPVLATAVREQIKYHRGNMDRFHKLSHRIHIAAPGFFFLTLLACLAHLFPSTHHNEKLSVILTFLAIIFPVAGAALEGISRHGEFSQIADRSKAILSNLEALLRELEDTKTSITFQRLTQHAETFSRIQLAEQAHWKSLFSGKSIPFP